MVGNSSVDYGHDTAILLEPTYLATANSRLSQLVDSISTTESNKCVWGRYFASGDYQSALAIISIRRPRSNGREKVYPRFKFI